MNINFYSGKRSWQPANSFQHPLGLWAPSRCLSSSARAEFLLLQSR
nr:MAG TPA: hypothetical protein [Bacteriophage sp.]